MIVDGYVWGRQDLDRDIREMLSVKAVREDSQAEAGGVAHREERCMQKKQ